jgi:predicted secreted protein
MIPSMRMYIGTALVLGLLGGCSMFGLSPSAAPKPGAAAAASAPAPRPVLIQNTGGRSITVADDNSGAGIVLEPTQELVVRLPLLATTGREWSLVDLVPGVMAVQSTSFERAARDTNIGEAAGSSVWRFKPIAAGTVTLRFDLRRPRSLDPAVQTVTYAVTVK